MSPALKQKIQELMQAQFQAGYLTAQMEAIAEAEQPAPKPPEATVEPPPSDESSA